MFVYIKKESKIKYHSLTYQSHVQRLEKMPKKKRKNEQLVMFIKIKKSKNFSILLAKCPVRISEIQSSKK
jgi:hypothetical protein